MFNRLATSVMAGLSRPPCFQIYGKARSESAWRIIGVYATHRRNGNSRWPAYLFRGTCITWTAECIAVGCDFAEDVLREQKSAPASREHPVQVASGRIRDPFLRAAAGASPFASASEVLAHECGHTWQMLRLGLLYWPIGAAFTLFREGPHWWNRFENQASEIGQFGGIVNGSVDPIPMSKKKRAYIETHSSKAKFLFSLNQYTHASPPWKSGLLEIQLADVVMTFMTSSPSCLEESTSHY